MKKAVVVLSGGIDSATALYVAWHNLDGQVAAISFDYGQKHKKELDYAKALCKRLKVTHEIVDLSSITKLISNSALTSDIDIPEGHYAKDNMKLTVVPNRNMIMFSIAIGYAVNSKATQVHVGVHSGDHTIYPDCRPQFIKALDLCGFLANEGFGEVEVIAPFMNISKAQIVKIGSEMKLPYELTWSCYKGGEKHCGKCGTCVERIEAFKLAGVTDPTEYENKTS